MEVKRIGLGLTKQTFDIHRVDVEATVVAHHALRQGKVLECFSQLPRCIVGIEACGRAHYGARDLINYGSRQPTKRQRC